MNKLKEAVDSLLTKIDLNIKSAPKENLITNSPNLSNNLGEQFSSALLQQSKIFREEMKEQFNLFSKSLKVQSKDFEEKLISALKIQSAIITENLKNKKNKKNEEGNQ